ncbi:MAG: hypothetical protein QME81_02145 [bacterium]|nr:hypothetical protein [bacterium]
MEDEKEAQIKEEIRQAVSNLVEAVKCSHREARVVLQATGFDLEKAKELIGSLSNKSIWIIKAKFKVDYLGNFGLFIIVLDVAARRVEGIEVVVSKDKRLFLYDVNVTWDFFEKAVHQVSLNRKEMVPETTHELFNRLKVGFDRHAGYLWDILEKPLKEIEDGLSHEVEKSVGIEGCELRFSIDRISSFHLDWIQSIEDLLHERKAESGSNKGSPPIKLKIALILAVEAGAPISTINVGQHLLVKLIDSSELGIYLAQLMGARKDEHLIPVVTVVEELQPLKDGMVKIRTKFGAKVFGEAVVSNNVKVKLAPQKLLPQANAVRGKIKDKERGFPYLLVISIIVIIWITFSVLFK